MEITYHTSGRLDSIAEFSAGKRAIIQVQDRNKIKRFASWIVLKSQPLKSNHKLFRD